MPLREILYFDSDKAVSFISQTQFGLIKEITTRKDETLSRRRKLGIAIANIFTGEIARETTKSDEIQERKELHHDLLIRVENVFREKKLVADLTELANSETDTLDQILLHLEEKPFIKTTGSCFIEDFSRINVFSKIINNQIDYINRSIISNSDNEDFKQLAIDIKRIERNLDRTKNQNDRFAKEIELRDKYEEISNHTGTKKIDQWVIEGISYWIDAYLKDRLIFRILPFERIPAFQVICNLKKEGITDKDIDYLISSYGQTPNLPFSVIGLITSKPDNKRQNLNPLDEFNIDEDLDNIRIFEQALRKMFPAIEGMESFTRFSRYPNITVEPIAIFREF